MSSSWLSKGTIMENNFMNAQINKIGERNFAKSREASPEGEERESIIFDLNQTVNNSF